MLIFASANKKRNKRDWRFDSSLFMFAVHTCSYAHLISKRQKFSSYFCLIEITLLSTESFGAMFTIKFELSRERASVKYHISVLPLQ